MAGKKVKITLENIKIQNEIFVKLSQGFATLQEYLATNYYSIEAGSYHS